MPHPAKKLFIKTYGCQMNVYDSERMADVLRPYGYTPWDSVKGADMVILNTCHIREKAAEKMYSDIGRIRAEKEKKKAAGGEMIIAVGGCVGQAEGEEIFKRAPAVDIVVGPQSYQTLPDLLSKVKRDKGHAINLDFVEEKKFDSLPKEFGKNGPVAFLSIQEGCDKFCTFCVVPYTRGAEFSRPVAEIYREAQQRAAQGAREIQLLGQNVNAYHGAGPEGGEWNLGKLIRHIATLPGVERIRYTTSHPRDMHEELYQAHEEEAKLMPFLHLPVQSGSDRILEAMNRKHTREDYFRIIERLRKIQPDMQFCSDIIVGFPGETEKDFEDTMDLVLRVNFAQCFSFMYSPRPGTPGAEREDQLPHEIKAERLYRLQKLLVEQQHAALHGQLGQTQMVLFERKGRYPGQYQGKNPYHQAVHVDDLEESCVGTLQPVTITKIHGNSLHGVLA